MHDSCSVTKPGAAHMSKLQEKSVHRHLCSLLVLPCSQCFLPFIKSIHAFIHYTHDFPEGQVRTVLISSLFWQLAYQQ